MPESIFGNFILENFKKFPDWNSVWPIEFTKNILHFFERNGFEPSAKSFRKLSIYRRTFPRLVIILDKIVFYTFPFPSFYPNVSFTFEELPRHLTQHFKVPLIRPSHLRKSRVVRKSRLGNLFAQMKNKENTSDQSRSKFWTIYRRVNDRHWFLSFLFFIRKLLSQKRK